MKNIFRNILFSVLLVAASAAYAVPGIGVTVFDPAGKVAYKGKTAANGTFATRTLEPGNYVVQFNGKPKQDNNYALVVSAGKQKVTADTVAGAQFGGGGVAMRVKVGQGLNITGQVFDATNVAGTKMKIVNGRRYFWATSGLGTNLGPRWVEEGTADAYNMVRSSPDMLRDVQEAGGGWASGR